MRNTWTVEDIDVALSSIKGSDVINAIRDAGRLGTSRWVLITDCCAELFADQYLASKLPEHSQLLRQVYIHMKETGYITPKEY